MAAGSFSLQLGSGAPLAEVSRAHREWVVISNLSQQCRKSTRAYSESHPRFSQTQAPLTFSWASF